jgi:hypothetical protein
MNSQCRGVSDVQGRLLGCLYEHQANLSPRCEAVVWGTMGRLGNTLAKNEAVRRECDRDSLQYCKETIAGGGNLVSCFLRAQMAMSPQCKAAVYSVWDRKGQRG